jgi:hypothetical protein
VSAFSKWGSMVENDSFGFANVGANLLAILPLGGSRGSDTYSARLNIDPVPMTPTDGYGSYIEPDTIPDYAPIFNPAFGFSLVGTSWIASIIRFEWALNPPAGETVTVYGWWYQNDVTGDIVCAGNFGPPMVITPGFHPVVVAPVEIQVDFCTVPLPPPLVLLSDTFGGAGSVALGSHTPDVGGPWTVVAGTLVAGGGDCSATSTGTSRATAPASAMDATVTGTAILNSSGVAETFFVYLYGTDTTTFLDASVTTTKVVLNGSVSGSSTVFATHPVSVSPGDTVTLSLAVSDSIAAVSLNGVFLASFAHFPLCWGESVGFGIQNIIGTPISLVRSVVCTTP